MTLQSKILKTKKRLSDLKWYLPSITITLMGLLATLSFCMRAVSVSWNYGLVTSYLPVLKKNVEQTYDADAQAKKAGSISSESVGIVINEFAIYFGTVSSFTTNYIDLRNKFMVPHYEGAPQIQTLLTEIERWKKSKPNIGDIAIVAAEPDFPAAILIQMIEYLNRSQMFSRVILSGGFL